MKKTLTFVLALFAVAPVLAGGIPREAVKGAVLGGVAGAVIGHNSGDHNGWRGAAIGAGTGFVVGSLVGDRHHSHPRYRGHRRSYYTPHTYMHRSSYRYPRHAGFRGYGYSSYGFGWSPYGYHSLYSRPNYIYLDRDFDGYGYGFDRYSAYGDRLYRRPNYAANGALLGALAGAVIGNNSGDLRHNGWRGAGYGALAGYVVGSIAENNARRREAASVYEASSQEVPQASAAQVGSSAPSEKRSVTASVERSSSTMASANSLFGR